MKIHAQRYFVPELLTVLICLAGTAGILARPTGGATVSLELKSRFHPRWEYSEAIHLRRRQYFTCA